MAATQSLAHPRKQVSLGTFPIRAFNFRETLSWTRYYKSHLNAAHTCPTDDRSQLSRQLALGRKACRDGPGLGCRESFPVT